MSFGGDWHADHGLYAQSRKHVGWGAVLEERGAALALDCGQVTAVGREERVILGRVRGAHGVRGLLRVQPFTEDRDTLLEFAQWMLGAGGQWQEVKLVSGHAHGSELLVKVAGIEDRDEAQQLRGSEVAVWRSQLPVLDEEEFYWSDLQGLRVVTDDGLELGVVERVFATGANDVLVVSGERERLIPFLPGEVVKQVDLQAGRIDVDWDPEFQAVIRFGVITLFPELVRALGIGGITARAMERALISVTCWNPRDYTEDRHHRVDDRPYGGGPGMVMSPQPLSAATRAAREAIAREAIAREAIAREAIAREAMSDEELAASGDEKRSAVHTVYLTPQGGRFDQARARELAQRKNLLLVCGRYEGVDERFIASEVDEELSLGDFVLSGGELPAMAVIEAITRLLPGALGHEESAVEDSFSGALLDWPHFTRPEEFEGRRVPEVLLSGDHKAIREWRAAQALARTAIRRPDLIRGARLTSAQHAQLERAQQHIEQGTSPKQEQEQ